MRRRRKKCWIVIAHQQMRKVIAIFEDPYEPKSQKEKEFEAITSRMVQKAASLRQQYPLHAHDIMVTWASDVADLQRGYPELLGWEKVMPQKSSGISR